MDKWCIHCGLKYEYDSSNPLGATSVACPSCQKKESRKGKKFELMLIAGNGEIQCRACGYNKYPYALKMIPCVEDRISKVTPEFDAKQSYLLCLNCEAGVKSGDLKVQVININSYPVDLSIWNTKVSVVQEKVEQHIPSSDAEVLEVVNEKETKDFDSLRRVSPTIRRLEE